MNEKEPSSFIARTLKGIKDTGEAGLDLGLSGIRGGLKGAADLAGMGAAGVELIARGVSGKDMSGKMLGTRLADKAGEYLDKIDMDSKLDDSKLGRGAQKVAEFAGGVVSPYAAVKTGLSKMAKIGSQNAGKLSEQAATILRDGVKNGIDPETVANSLRNVGVPVDKAMDLANRFRAQSQKNFGKREDLLNTAKQGAKTDAIEKADYAIFDIRDFLSKANTFSPEKMAEYLRKKGVDNERMLSKIDELIESNRSKMKSKYDAELSAGKKYNNLEFADPIEDNVIEELEGYRNMLLNIAYKNRKKGDNLKGSVDKLEKLKSNFLRKDAFDDLGNNFDSPISDIDSRYNTALNNVQDSIHGDKFFSEVINEVDKMEPRKALEFLRDIAEKTNDPRIQKAIAAIAAAGVGSQFETKEDGMTWGD